MQPKINAVFGYRARVDQLQEIERLRKDMNRGLAHSLLAEVTGAEIATQVIQGTYQEGKL